jgi:hypothetical protein
VDLSSGESEDEQDEEVVDRKEDKKVAPRGDPPA